MGEGGPLYVYFSRAFRVVVVRTNLGGAWDVIAITITTVFPVQMTERSATRSLNVEVTEDPFGLGLVEQGGLHEMHLLGIDTDCFCPWD
jgi:hypothetical protein